MKLNKQDGSYGRQLITCGGIIRRVKFKIGRKVAEDTGIVSSRGPDSPINMQAADGLLLADRGNTQAGFRAKRKRSDSR